MTNSSPNPSPQPPHNRSNLIVRFLQRARSRSTIATGVSLLVLSVAGYAGVRFFVYQKLPGLLSKQLSQTLNRQVQVGEVESFSVTGIRFGTSEIPATPTDPDTVSIGSIQIGFNLLPVLLRRALPVSITLADLDAYIAQDEEGKWINLELKKLPKQPPIELDIKVKLQEAEIALLAYGNKEPLKVGIEADGRYNQVQPQQLQYDLRTIVSQGLIQIKGKTLLETGNSQVQVAAQNLVLADLTSLIPNSSVALKDGELNAKLNLEVPSLEKLPATKTEGQVILSPIEAKIKPLLQPVNASASLRFIDTKMQVEQGEVSLGKIVAQIGGEVDWERGYDLNVNAKSFSLTNLLSTVPVSMPFEIDGSLEFQLKLTGALAQPVLNGRLKNTQNIRLDKVEFKEISTLFQADLEKFVLTNLQVVPVAGGEITGQGTLETRLIESVREKKSIDLMAMPLELDFEVELPHAIATPYYKLPPQIAVGNITAQAQVRGTLAQPQASLKWQSRQKSDSDGLTSISAGGEILLQDKNIVLRDTAIQTDQGKITIDASSNLATKTWQSFIYARSFALNPFLASICQDGTKSCSIILDNAQIQLSGRLDTFDPATIQGVANLILQVDGGSAVVNSQLSGGTLQLEANAGKIPLVKFLPDLPLPVSLVTSQVNFSGSLQQLLSLGSNPNLNNLKANANLRLAVGDGTLQATTQFNNGQLQSSIASSGIDSSFPDLKAQLTAAIALSPLAETNPSASIQAKTISIEIGGQSLQAQGNISISNLTTAPDINRLKLDIKARSDLDTLPLSELLDLDLLPVERNLLPQRIDLTGEGDFQGRLVGKNLLSAPLAAGNLQLLGKLQLSNFSFNQLVFDPLLVGSVQISPGEKLAIDLRGQDDAIAAVLEPCRRRRCIFPYLPVSFEFRQGEGLENLITASGKRQGERLIVDVNNFPLSLLNIAPTTEIGIIGTLEGEVTAQLDINLVTLAANGNLQIQQPGIGLIQAQEFAASISSQNNLVSLESASLKFERSQYDFEGSLNVKSGEVNGKLSVAKAYVEDVLTALQISTLESLVSFLQFQRPSYAKAAELKVQSVGDTSATLAQQINTLWQIDRRIRELAIEKRAGAAGTDVDIAGAYTADITLAGTWKQPQIEFKLQGSKWQWRPKPAFPSIVESLGLVIEDTQLIPVHQVLIQGSWQEGILTLEPMEIKIGDATIYVAGNLSAHRNSAKLSLKNLSLDTISDIVKLPLDVAGQIDLEVNLEGSLTQPQVKAEVAWSDGAINGRSLEDRIAANLSYSNSRLEVRTTYPDSLQIYASIPYLSEPRVSERFDIELELSNKAVSSQERQTSTKSTTLVQDLLAGLTQGEILWVSGSGKIALKASGRLNLTQQVKVSDLIVTGEVIFEDAQFKNPSIAKELNLTGKITLDKQRLRAEQLQGKFAETNLLITGVLPVWQPLIEDDPEANPLTVSIDKGQMNFPKLYQGKVDTQVTVTGTVIAPEISGEVRLYQGEAFIPERKDTDEEFTPAIERWAKAVQRNVVTPYGAIIAARLNNFQVVLGDGFVFRNRSAFGLGLPGIFSLSLAPAFQFSLSGDVTLNGSLDNLQNLQPQGTIRLTSGNIEALATKVFVARRYDNRIDFTPKEGLLNPNLDIQLKTYLINISTASTIGSEIPDDITRSGRVRSIELTIAVNARVSELLPQLGREISDVCQIRPTNIEPIPETDRFSSAELQQLATCVKLGALEGEFEQQLLQSGAITLTSSPALTTNEIIALLGQTNKEAAEALQQQSGAQLLSLGFAQLVLAPLLNNVLFEVNEGANYAGRQIGLSDVRLYPVIETVPQVGKNSFVRVSYDYIYNEAKVTYETLFK